MSCISFMFIWAACMETDFYFNFFFFFQSWKWRKKHLLYSLIYNYFLICYLFQLFVFDFHEPPAMVFDKIIKISVSEFLFCFMNPSLLVYEGIVCYVWVHGNVSQGCKDIITRIVNQAGKMIGEPRQNLEDVYADLLITSSDWCDGWCKSSITRLARGSADSKVPFCLSFRNRIFPFFILIMFKLVFVL